jgi:hypothetical protein
MCAENPINTVSAHRAIPTVVSGYDSLTLGRVVVENFGISGTQVFADSPAKAPTRQARPQHDRSGRPELWTWKRVRPQPSPHFFLGYLNGLVHSAQFSCGDIRLCDQVNLAVLRGRRCPAHVTPTCRSICQGYQSKK